MAAFGFIFAARDRRPSSLGQICHYAIKVQYYNTHQNGTADILRHHSMSRYTHKEAFALHFLRSCDRISQIHEAGVHGQYAVIVMDQFGVRPDREMNTFPEVTHRNAQVLDMCAYTGAHFIFEDKALFIEVQVCKVVSDVLEALLFMNDRKIVHEDMGLKNILVDSDLRVSCSLL